MFVYDTIRQNVFLLLYDIDGRARACAHRNLQGIPVSVATQDSGEDENFSIIIAWSRSVTHVNASSVCHFLNKNLPSYKLHKFLLYYLASLQGMTIDVKVVIENVVNVLLISPVKKKSLLVKFPLFLLVFLYFFIIIFQVIILNICDS